MSPRSWARKRRISPFGVVLVLVGAFLAVRSWSAAQTVLVPMPGGSRVTVPAREPLLAVADHKDQILSETDRAERDPFMLPPAPRPTGPRPTAPVVTHTPPVVRLIHFDSVSPEVLLEVDGQLSGRLSVGQTFLGWAVVSISPKVVEVYKDGKTYQLSPRR